MLSDALFEDFHAATMYGNGKPSHVPTDHAEAALCVTRHACRALDTLGKRATGGASF